MSLPVLASEWERRSSPDNPIQMWVQSSKGTPPEKYTPYKLIRAEATLSVPILPLLALIQDAEQQHHWIPYAHRVTVLPQDESRLIPGQTLVHFRSHSQWPFKARDAVVLFSVSQPKPNQIHIRMANQPNALPDTKGFVRIDALEGEWVLTAQASCETHLHYVAGSVGGGNLPQWIVDKLNFSTSHDIMQNLQQWAMNHYRDYLDHDNAYGFLAPPPLHKHCP